jgi:hypothetical protein
MTTDWSNLERNDDLVRDIVEKKAEVAQLSNLMAAIDFAQNLDEVSDERRKEVFISRVSFEELDRLYKFLWRFTG